MGTFYCRKQDESKQKRPPWQEAVFIVVDKLGRLSPTGRRFGSKANTPMQLLSGLSAPLSQNIDRHRKRDLPRRMNQPFSVSDLLGYYSPSIQTAGGEQPDRTLDLNIFYYRSSWRCLQTKKSRPDRAGREKIFIAAGRSAGLNSCRAKCRLK